MCPFHQRLIQLILGKRGGSTRTKMIQMLREKPYNTNQMALLLGLNYRTIKYHVNKLLQNGIIEGSGTEGYGQVYYLSKEMNDNYDVFEKVVKRFSDIKTSPHMFENIIEQTHDAVFFLEGGGRVLYLNESAERLYGYSEDDILGKGLDIFIDPGLLEKILDPKAGEREIGPLDTKGRTKSGETVDINVHVETVEDAEGETVGIYLLSRDIRERKRVEAALRDAEEFLEDVLETIPIPLVLLDKGGGVVYANPTFCNLFGIEQKDALRKNLHEIGSKGLDIPELRGQLEELLSHDVRIDDLLVDLDLPNGGPRSLLLNARPLFHRHERTTQMLLTLEELPRKGDRE